MGQLASAPPPPPVRPGQVVAGKYRVEHAIAAGGMGLVFAAKHVALGQAVALKFLRSELRGMVSTSRFTMEARATAKLRSAHIARVFDVGVLEDGTPFMVMELLEGIDLEHLLEERGRLSAEIAAELVTQACEAVNEAHEVGIVHRDLKPANLFLTRTPQGAPFVKVLDFGISKATIDPESKSATVAGTILGSPPYMAPETLKSSKNAEARSDIWALGVILYELVTGRLPFDGEGIGDLALKVHQDEPLWPIAIDPDIPKEYDAIVRRCLEKEAKNRYPSVEDLRDALLSFSSHRSASTVTLSLRTSQPRIVVLDEKDASPRTEERVKQARSATTLVPGATSSPLGRLSARTLGLGVGGLAAVAAALAVVALTRTALPPASAQPEIVAVASTAVPPATADPPPGPAPAKTAEPENPAETAAPPPAPPAAPPPAPLRRVGAKTPAPRLAETRTAAAEAAPAATPAPPPASPPSPASPKAIRDRGF